MPNAQEDGGQLGARMRGAQAEAAPRLAGAGAPFGQRHVSAPPEPAAAYGDTAVAACCANKAARSSKERAEKMKERAVEIACVRLGDDAASIFARDSVR